MIGIAIGLTLGVSIRIVGNGLPMATHSKLKGSPNDTDVKR